MVAHRLGQDEAYFTVREILAEASTTVPPKAGLCREPSDFSRWRFATLGLKFKSSEQFLSIRSDPSLKKEK